MLECSKWIKISLLIDAHEMRDLFQSVDPFQLYQVQKVTNKGEGLISSSFFLEKYADYIDCLKKKHIPPSHFGPLFSPVLSVTDEALYAMPVSGERQLYKARLPVIQMQPHAICYSPLDQSFRSKAFGSDSITWGIQIGYPQLYVDGQTHAILTTRELPNGLLFRGIQKWVRRYTVPTPFVVNGKQTNVPIRLGKSCFEWIAKHPQLKREGISIANRTNTSSIYQK